MTAAVRSHDADTPPRPRAPADIMRAQSLAAMQPCRISAARALMIRAVRDNPLTKVEDRDEWHARLGWLICAWDVLIEARTNRRY